MNRKQIDKAEKVARDLDARRHSASRPSRMDAEAVRGTEEYRQRLAQIEAVREAARWIRPPSLSDGRVTLRTRHGEVVPEFEEWQLMVALRSLEKE